MTPSIAEPAPQWTPSAVAAWVTAVLFWLYYMSAFLVPQQRPWQMPVLLGAAGLAAVAAILLRDRTPLLAVAVVGGLLLLSASGIGAAFVVQATVASRYGRSRLPLLSGGWLLLGKLGQQLLGPYTEPWSQASGVELTVAVGGLTVATLAGWLSRSRSAEQRSRVDAAAAREQADRARMEQVRLNERERIAREMHDVLAHRISLVAMHSAALAHRDDLDAATTRETARTIQQNARTALDELRAVLSDLRAPDEPPEPPQPTLQQLPALIAEARESGQRVVSSITGPSADLPDQVGRAAFRIVQEGLTNARKHAPGAPVEVRVAVTGAGVEVTVCNPLADLVVADASGSGLGLVGITERAELLGGSIVAGSADGSYRLRALLPTGRTEGRR